MTPRRPTRTTAADCRVRGGEFVAYDRADYKTALNVWLPAAEQGDPEAQVNVGEIFERGLGEAPNYEVARVWYEKAAAQGNRRAQFNLGTFYEQGLGVASDPVKALNWYREAWGIPQDNITFRSALDGEMARMEARHQKESRQRQLQIQALSLQLDTLRAELNAGNRQAALQISELEELVVSLRQQQGTADESASEIRLREPASAPREPLAPQRAATDIWANDLNFGKYYALVVGNQDYEKIEDLQTPRSDAQAIGQMLTDKYGFEVTTLVNVDNVRVMEEINRLSGALTESDNLLIFYTGHGIRRQAAERESGYWLPVNSDPAPNDTYWISNEFVSGHLARIKARRVLVIADSCYAGLHSTSPAFLMLESRAVPDPEYLDYKAKRRSRLLLSSGGDKPVLDNGGGDHSVFAGAVLRVLGENEGMLMGPEFFQRVRELTVASARQFDFEQQPEFKVIKGAGHEIGDFFFIPVSS